MIKRFLPLLVLLMLANPAMASTQLLSDSKAVRNFINEMVEQHAFNSNELQSVFAEAHLHQSILDAISRPAESKPWYDYRPIFVTADRSKGGVNFWQQHIGTLQKASSVYGVPEEIMVAIIGVETRYGRHTGRYPVLDALSTLAFAYPPRSSFFRKELKEYLLMTREEGLTPGKQLGSYAGAMGMPQFIPSSFRHYAVDFDNDGKRDLWTSPADAIGSVGNYFKRHHWKPGQPIASPVKVHGNRYQALVDGNLKPRYSPQELMDNGVILPQGLPNDLKGVLLKLETRDGPEYWVGWHNFYVISRYNHSALYSMAVFQLSQQIKQQSTGLVASEAGKP
jgi:membrane-bound lytic murein transglycosylase B